jgi:hypothetical protein
MFWNGVNIFQNRIIMLQGPTLGLSDYKTAVLPSFNKMVTDAQTPLFSGSVTTGLHLAFHHPAV